MPNDEKKLTHEERINTELRTAGVSRFGMKKFTVKHIPKVIHKNEHIMAVIYGRYADKSGSNSWNEGFLIATDARIIFLDHKPGYTTMDELGYDVVSGVNFTTAVFSAVSLFTRLGDYKIRFANTKCAKVFVQYVEQRRLESTYTR